MRGYSNEAALRIARNLKGLEDYFAIEVTMNTQDALAIIRQLHQEFSPTLKVGAGTVRNLTQAQEAVDAGAVFILGPHTFSENIFEFCKVHNILAIPGAYTPSEIHQQLELGADIVKVFPASTLGTSYLKDIQAPLGDLPLMAVGGINPENYQQFLDGGASYVGIGSGIFQGKKIELLNDNEIREILESYTNILREKGSQ